MKKSEIINQLQELVNAENLEEVKQEAEQLFVAFTEQLQAGMVELKEQFVNDGGDALEFKYEHSEEDLQFNNLKTTFEQRLQHKKEEQSTNKSEALNERKKIISELEAIVKTDVKNLGKHFRKASELQDRWKATEHYDTDEFNELDSKYKSDLDKFYYNAQIVKDAIELDYQKNKTAKAKVIEKIKSLGDETDVTTLERKIRQYEKEWFRVGPVKKEIREESKQELADAVESLQPKLDELYENQKELLQENLTKKLAICERLNAVLDEEYTSPKQYQQAADKVIALQEDWKDVGRSNENDRIWEVFKGSCDSFFDSKRNFFKNLSGKRKENKDQKEELIKKAESLKNSTDWKKTSNALIQLQKKWKTIGPAHPAEDQKLWNRFRGACDTFFNARKEHYKERDKEYAENLAMKNTLIDQVKEFKTTGNTGKDVQQLQGFEKQYKSIGFVPFKQKDKIHKAFYGAINKHYESLDINKQEKNKMRFESKIKSMATGRKPDKTLNYERNKIKQRMDELKNTLAQYENNFNIVSGDKNNPLLKTVLKNKRDAERELESLAMQISLIKDAKAGKFDEEE